MKNLLFVLLLLPAVALSQATNKYEYVVRKDTAKIFGAKLEDRAYSATTLDTSITYNSVDWKNTYVAIASTDSAQCYLKYQLSVDNENWGVATTKDSLATATATGDVKTIDISSIVNGAPYFRLIFDFTVSVTSGVPQGTTSAKYWAVLTRKQD